MENSNGARIFVVDDDEGLLESLSQVLTQAGHEFGAFTDAVTAQKALGGHEAAPDLVIVSVKLSGDSGLAFLGQMRARRPEIPVIVLSQDPLSPSAIELTRQGAYDRLIKPLGSPYETMMIIGRALDHRLLSRRVRELEGATARGPAASGGALTQEALQPFSQAKQAAVIAFERWYMEHVLARSQGNIAVAARMSGLDKSNFRRILRRHGVDLPAIRAAIHISDRT